MARGTLHAQKPDGQRRRRNAPAHDTTVLVRDGEVRGPELVEITGKSDWNPRVVAWWDTWRRAPQAQLFEETDWFRLSLLATTVEHLATVYKPSAALLAELRMNEERLGATVTDRLRARMTIQADDTEPAPVVQLVKSAEDDVFDDFDG